jgi:hypothetical protein
MRARGGDASWGGEARDPDAKLIPRGERDERCLAAESRHVVVGHPLVEERAAGERVPPRALAEVAAVAAATSAAVPRRAVVAAAAVVVVAQPGVIASSPVARVAELDDRDDDEPNEERFP